MLRDSKARRSRHRAKPQAAAAARLLAVAAAVLAAGCATLAAPTGPSKIGGLSQQETDQGQAYPQLIAAPPGVNWTPEDIVNGFLIASASFANGHAIAREYLTPSAARRWHPTWAVTVLSGVPKPSLTHAPHQVLANSGTVVGATVSVTGQPLSTLNSSGQPLPPSASQRDWVFKLVKGPNGQWQITNPPSQLLLTSQAFLQVYQPRNLYFYSPSGRLVPDPVFVPQLVTETVLASNLVRALTLGGPPPGSWLNQSVQTAFPAHTTLLGPVRVDGTLATVDLGGAAAHAGQNAVRRMAAQLVWTLTSPAYGLSQIQSVALEIDGRPWGPNLLLRNYPGLVPAQQPGAPLYFTGSHGTLRWSGPQGKGGSLPGAAGASDLGFSAIAVSPAAPGKETMLAGIVPARGCVVDTAPLDSKATFTRHVLPGSPCTSLSWDDSGELWVAAGKAVWVLLPGTGTGAEQLSGLPSAGSVSVFRVAPDGVRAVLIVQSKAGRQVMLGSIVHDGSTPFLQGPVSVGAGIADPVSVSWYGADHIVVLSGSGSGSQLTDVPLDGEPGTSIGGAPAPVTSMTASGSAITIAARRGTGSYLYTLPGLGQPWQQAGSGSMPVYPG
jgi:spore germination protein GerM